jgi:hypothetical protein
MNKVPEGWGNESRHKPAAGSAEGGRDTIGVWSAYDLPQRYIDAESQRIKAEGDNKVR